MAKITEAELRATQNYRANKKLVGITAPCTEEERERLKKIIKKHGKTWLELLQIGAQLLEDKGKE